MVFDDLKKALSEAFVLAKITDGIAEIKIEKGTAKRVGTSASDELGGML